MQVTGFQYGNGIYASYGFSADRLQLTCLDYSTTNRSGSCAHDSTTKFGLTYSYGSSGSNNGQISGITDSVDNGRSVTYTYDTLYRLSTAITTGSSGYTKWGLSWSYDRYGNRTGQSSSYDSPPTNSVTVSATTNRITTSGYGYDANGNMTNDGYNTLVFDGENRETSATNGGSSGTYSYDGNNLRVKKVSGSTTTVYLFSGSKVIAEYDNGAAPSSPSREYLYASSQLLAKIDSSGTKYYQQDELSNRLVTDSSGNVLAQLGHYPFGESWYNSTGDKLLFTSYERDAESGNDYALARSYVNRLARFSSVDPLAGSSGDPQTLNRYSYTLGDPVNLLDPTGLDCFPIFVAGNWQMHCDVAAPFLPGDGSGGASGGGTFGNGNGHIAPLQDQTGAGGGNSSGSNPNPAKVCIDPKSLNFLQKAQVFAAQTYAKLTGLTFGFGAGLDAGAGAGPKGTSWNFGLGGSASTLIVADASGNSGFLNSASGGFAAAKMSSAGSWWGAGAAAGPSVLVSPFSINTIAGPSFSASGGGGSGVLGGGGSITTSGAFTITAGWGAGAEGGFSAQFGPSQFIPFCKN